MEYHSIEKTGLSFPRKLSIMNSFCVHFPFSVPGFCRSCTQSHNLCGFILQLPCCVWRLLLPWSHPSPLLLQSFCPLFHIVPWALDEEYDIHIPFRAEISKVLCMVIGCGLIAIYSKKRLLLWGLKDALICKLTHSKWKAKLVGGSNYWAFTRQFESVLSLLHTSFHFLLVIILWSVKRYF